MGIIRSKPRPPYHSVGVGKAKELKIDKVGKDLMSLSPLPYKSLACIIDSYVSKRSGPVIAYKILQLVVKWKLLSLFLWNNIF
jgi:hypothetical protein